MRSPQVIACVDGSSHTLAVCDHAAWLAERLTCGVALLTVAEPPALTADGVLHNAADRIQDAGGDLVSLLTRSGGFLAAAVEAANFAHALVIGRRGCTSPVHSARLGQNTRRLLAAAPCPLLLAGASRRPATRALILFDRAHGDDALSSLLAVHPALDGVDCDLRAFGRARPGRHTIGPDQAIVSALRQKHYDLVVLPRGALLAEPRRRELEGLLTLLGLPVLLPALRRKPSFG